MIHNLFSFFGICNIWIQLRCPICALQSIRFFCTAWPREVLIVAFGMNRTYVAWHGLFEKNTVNFGIVG